MPVVAWEGRWLAAILAAGLVVALLVWGLPYAASAYHLEVGGQALEETVQGDGLDLEALGEAVTHLEAAVGWQEGNAHAHLLLGQAHTLRGDLVEAAWSLTRFTALRPGYPLGWWELGQVYAAMALRSATVSRPDLGDGQSEWALPLAPASQAGLEATPGAGILSVVEQQVLAMEPPGRVDLALTVPSTATLLAFWMGTDPSQGESPATLTFRLAVDDREVFSRSLSAEEAGLGWWPGQVDLHDWADQEISLALSIEADPPQEEEGGRAGWGDVRWLAPDATPYAGLAPAERLEGAWRRAGFGAQQALTNLDRAWQAGQYDRVPMWYRLARSLGAEIPASTGFRAAIAAISMGLEPPRPSDTDQFPVYTLTDSVRIEGEALQWIYENADQGVDYGTRLSDFPYSDPEVGVMWWQGTAVAVVQVPREGNYQVTVRARHNAKDSAWNLHLGQLQVGHNLAPLAVFSLAPDWQQFRTAVRLSRGLHVIDVRYMYDDGDAILDWISLGTIDGE